MRRRTIMRISRLFHKMSALMTGALMMASLAVPSAAVMADEEKSVNVALCVYGLTSQAAQGQPVTITGDGQYTVEFDCDADAAGESIVLKDFVAIYISDTDVLAGNTKRSPLETCDIVYDSITVDDKELTIEKKDAKSALKDSGIFDTNDPINGWDGSVVADSDIVWNKTDHKVAFAGNDAAKKVSITFTLSNVKWKPLEDSEIFNKESKADSETVSDETTETTAVSDKATDAAKTTSDSSSKMPTGAVIGIIAVVVVVIVIIVAVSVSKKKKNK